LNKPAQVEALAQCSNVCVVAQTTFNLKIYGEILDKIRIKYPNAVVYDTICKATNTRQNEAAALARECDIVIVVGGKNSANTSRLKETVEQNGCRAVLIETESEISPDLFRNVKTIGITAGASTPNWMINRVVNKTRKIAALQRNAITRTFQNFISFLIYSRLYMAAGAASVTLLSCEMLGIQLKPLYLLVTGLYMHAMYILNHLTDKETYAFADLLKSSPIIGFRKTFMAWGLISGLASLAISWFLGYDVCLFMLICTAAGILYNFNIVPKSVPIRYKRIKDFPLSKDIGIAVAWACTVVFVPLFHQHSFKLGPRGIIAFIFIFFLALVRTIQHDMQDIQRDRIIGKETLPIFLGRDFVRWITVFIYFMLIMVIVGGTFISSIPFAESALLLIPPAYGLGVFLLFIKGKIAEPLSFMLLVDFNFILAGLLSLFIL
ncbi:MAG: UbiA family prenyltransferase, partial [bacterium]